MRAVGIILIAAGLSLLVFIGYHFIAEKSRLKSPLPEEEGVKVIFVTPSNQN